LLKDSLPDEASVSRQIGYPLSSTLWSVNLLQHPRWSCYPPKTLSWLFNLSSPRFPDRQPQLQAIFSVVTLRETWRNKVRYALRGRYVPDPVGFIDYHLSLNANCERLNAELANGSYRTSPPLRLLKEKSKGLCRQIVLPSIDDSIVLQRLADSFFAAIRGKTPTKYAFFEPDSFSFPSTERHQYGSFAAWLHFQNHLFSITQRRKFLIITDIANYYDHIGYEALRNILSSSISVPEIILDLLIYSLSGLTWQPDYMPRVNIGLPQIDLDAPRVLAHSFLFDLDQHAFNRVGTDYTRYMDDINFGVDTISEAKKIIRDVDLILHTRQVRLNSGKTGILKASEARKFLRIADHQELDQIQAELTHRRTTGISLDVTAAKIESMITKKYRSRNFDDGHGEKILKRMLTLARQSGASIHRSILLDTLKRRPSCRDSVLTYLAARPLDAKSLSVVEAFLEFPEIVDDVSYLAAVSALVEMRTPSRPASKPAIDRIVGNLEQNGSWCIYSALWLLSKYGSPQEILEFLQRQRTKWSTDQTLGRLVGGLYPRFINSDQRSIFESIIDRSGNLESTSMLRFHQRLNVDRRAAISVRPYISSPNPSRSTGITHSKFLVMLNVLQNAEISEVYKTTLVARHRAVWRDAYYRPLATAALPISMRSAVA